MRNLINTTKQTIWLVGRDRPWRWFGLIALALIVAGFEAAGAVLIYTLMGLISMSENAIDLPFLGDVTELFPDADRATVMVGAAILVAAFFIIRGLVLVGRAYVQARIIENATADLAEYLVRGYLRLPYLWHTQQNSAVLVRNTFDSVGAFGGSVLTPVVVLGAETTLVLGLLAVLVAVSPLATGLAIGLMGPLVWLLLRSVQPRLRKLGRRSQDAKEGTLKALQQGLGGIRDIRLLAREHHFLQVFRKERRDLARTKYLQKSLKELPRALIETTLVLVIVLVFVIAVLDGVIEGLVSTLGVFAYTGLRLQPSLRNIVGALNSLRFSAAVLDDLSADRKFCDAVLSEDRSSRQIAGERDFGQDIRLQDVSFRYGPDGPLALEHVDLRIRKGEFVGVCGPTGGGKSTLVDLIVGLLSPTSGEVLIDGRGLKDLAAWWFDQLGVVSQSVFLIDDTLRANIAFGQREADVDEELLRRSIERAQLQEVIRKLPDGLDTMVGERGIRLSGGQRQRVSIARALYREPAVIVFDEGTSALDSATEAALVAAVDDLKEGRTLISVAHRLSTVQRADRILVVENGRIVAEGSYDDLLERSELFRALAP